MRRYWRWLIHINVVPGQCVVTKVGGATTARRVTGAKHE
jgi:hypothetical protein